MNKSFNGQTFGSLKTTTASSISNASVRISTKLESYLEERQVNLRDQLIASNQFMAR